MAESTVTRKTGKRGRVTATHHSVESFTIPGRFYNVTLYRDGSGELCGASCSCPARVEPMRDKHVKSLIARPYQIVTVHDSRVPGMRYDIYGPEGYEGRCISFADAYEVIVDELGGVLGEAGVGGYFGGEVA